MRPDPSVIKEEGPSAFWRRNARRYDQAIAVLNPRFSRMVAMVAQDVSGIHRVLEVAAGTGLVSVALAPVVGDLTATDASPEMLTILGGRLAEAGHVNVRVMAADLLSLEFAESSFDAVVAANVLHLLTDPGAALAEVRRVLRPGGLLCVPTFGHGQNLLARGVSRLLALLAFPIVTRFRSETLRRAVETAGFEVVREEVVPGTLPILFLTARKAESKLPGG